MADHRPEQGKTGGWVGATAAAMGTQFSRGSRGRGDADLSGRWLWGLSNQPAGVLGRGLCPGSGSRAGPSYGPLARARIYITAKRCAHMRGKQVNP